MVELGYVGLATLLVFIIATLHGVGRMAQRDLARAWVVLSLLLFIIMFNFLESLWMRAFDMLWVVFLILVAEVGRYWQPARVAARAGDPAPSKPRSPSHRGRGLRQGY